MSRTNQRYNEMMHAARRLAVGVESIGKLVKLVRKAFRAGERYCNVNERGLDRVLEGERRKVERYAMALGLSVSWPGLYPHLVMANGEVLYLPD